MDLEEDPVVAPMVIGDFVDFVDFVLRRVTGWLYLDSWVGLWSVGFKMPQIQL